MATSTNTTEPDDCTRRSFPDDAVAVTTLVEEHDWLTDSHIRELYRRGRLCHWRVGRKVLVSRADWEALLDAGLNAARDRKTGVGANAATS